MILSDSKSTIDFSKMEFIPECSADFPTACYAYNLLSRTEPWHWHDQFEIAFLLSGQAKLLLEGREYLLSAGSGYMINSGALHALTNEPDISCQVCCIVFSKELPGGNHDSLFYRNMCFLWFKAALREPFLIHRANGKINCAVLPARPLRFLSRSPRIMKSRCARCSRRF